MTNEQIVKLLNIEKECIIRNNRGCGHKCEACDLVQTDETLLEMYDTVIKNIEWIDARRQLPNEEGYYLVFIPGEFNDTMMVARYTFNSKIPWRGAQAHSAIEDVVFWKPLPQKPKY